MDLIASFSKFLQQPVIATEAADSEDMMKVLLGKTNQGRHLLVQQGGALSIVKDNWKYIEPNAGIAFNKLTGIELGNAPAPQLYDLNKDIREQNNLADKYPEKVKELKDLLQKIKDQGSSNVANN